MYSEERLILASASPRRKMLLESLGYKVDVVVADVDECRFSGESAVGYVERVSRLKGQEVYGRGCGNFRIVSGDTIVVSGEVILGKPRDNDDAFGMLKRLVGRVHRVYSGVCVVDTRGVAQSFVSETLVEFGDISDEFLRYYVSTGEPLDKAGAYGIQGIGGSLVARIDGSYSNVVGMDVYRLGSLLRGEGEFISG